MLSVVLYGRNDSHGYNLHKRGAVSLNAIAHLLRDADDELIFVDYNTPDDLPTFPEAIADTLTAHAREKLRILRVRPAQHARFVAQTHLVALEPIARNVAARRSNPANRWVLSTNTDMIFVPRDETKSLGDIVGGLGDGFYHLPRFELPEALWESLDRADAAGIVKAAGDWGQRFHLDEVVRSGSDNLFDGPGDFQLFLRDDLLAIGGFDERMLKGWHVDANVARRMRFLRGKVWSAEPYLRGYHCDHTRQASPYHKGDRVENDAVRFVDRLEGATLPDQMQSFGLAEEVIEEVRLGHASSARYLIGLEAAIPTAATGVLQTAYVADAFGQLAYPLDHILPYLLDLVSCIPLDARIAYLGGRRDTYDAFAKGWAAMGGAIPPAPPTDAAWLPNATLSLEAWTETADVFVFEFGAEQASEQKTLLQQERERLWWVNRGLAEAFASDERRQRDGEPARRVIVVNAIHNSIESQLFRHLSVTLTPYSSRIRHGFIVDPERAPCPPSWAAAARACGRELPFTAAEVAACAQALKASLAVGEPTADARRLQGPLVALLDAEAPELPSRNEPGVADALQRLTADHALRPTLPVGVQGPSDAPGASRLIRAEDWSDPAFMRMAYALFPNRRHDDPAEHIAWSWERVALAVNLATAKPLSARPHVLVLAALPELLAFMLSNLGARVDIADPHALAKGVYASVDWRAELIENTFAVPGSAEPLALIEDRKAAFADGYRYDAVLLPQNALFAVGRDGATELLRQASCVLKTDGHLGLAALALVNDVEPLFFGDNLAVDLIREGRLAGLMEEKAGLSPCGGVEARLSSGTLDSIAPDEGGAATVPALLVEDGPALRAPCVFAFTLSRQPEEAGWEAVDRAIRTGFLRGEPPIAQSSTVLSEAEVQRLSAAVADGSDLKATGSVLRRLIAAEGVEHTPRSARAPAGEAGRVVLSGPIGRLDPGAYDLRVQGIGGEPGAYAYVLNRDGVIAWAPVLHDGAQEWLLPFEVKGPLSASISVAVQSTGVEIEVLEVAVD